MGVRQRNAHKALRQLGRYKGPVRPLWTPQEWNIRIISWPFGYRQRPQRSCSLLHNGKAWR